MIQASFEAIGKDEIENLIQNCVTESKTLEYKEKLPGTTDKDKKEFLADVASFANSSGGDIIYGVKAAVNAEGKKTGEPESIVPLQGQTSDEVKLWIENLIRTGIEPRLSIQVKEIAVNDEDESGFIIVIRVPQSYASPHMIIFKNWSRFLCRNSAGKYQLDVSEIRNAFLATDSQADRVRGFIQGRYSQIISDETPLELLMTQRLILHIIPLTSFLNRYRHRLNGYREFSSDYKPIAVQSWDDRYNFDGFVTYQTVREKKVCRSYCQVFFDGTIEAVHADILVGSKGAIPQNGERRLIPSEAYEYWIVEALCNYLKGYKALGIYPPFIISMGLVGCKGVYLATKRMMGFDETSIDRNVAIFPEVNISSFDDNVPSALKPIFDSVWNAFGFPRSFNYTDEGEWKIK